MDEFKGTDGEWAVEGDVNDESVLYPVVYSKETGEQVCMCDGEDRLRNHTNAALIAASKKLLRAAIVYTKLLESGTRKLREGGARSLDFQAKADQSTAALIDLKAAITEALRVE